MKKKLNSNNIKSKIKKVCWDCWRVASQSNWYKLKNIVSTYYKWVCDFCWKEKHITWVRSFWYPDFNFKENKIFLLFWKEIKEYKFINKFDFIIVDYKLNRSKLKKEFINSWNFFYTRDWLIKELKKRINNNEYYEFKDDYKNLIKKYNI